MQHMPANTAATAAACERQLRLQQAYLHGVPPAALCCVQSSKSAPNIVSDWSNTKASTEQTMKLMQMYKDLGDFEGQVRVGVG
jgi:hypothetical protein